MNSGDRKANRLSRANEMSAPRNAALSSHRIVTLLILALAGITIDPATNAVRRLLGKRIIPIRKPLLEFAAHELASFSVETESPLEPPFDVGTQEWFGITLRCRERAEYAGAMDLSVSYYPVSELRLLHTPEVCYRAAGFEIRSVGTVAATARLDVQTTVPVEACYVHFATVRSGRTYDTLVVYGYCANGRFFNGRNAVRGFLSLPWVRSVYLAKVECSVQIVDTADLDTPLRIGTRLLEEALPLLYRDHFPVR